MKKESTLRNVQLKVNLRQKGIRKIKTVTSRDEKIGRAYKGAFRLHPWEKINTGNSCSDNCTRG